MKSTTEIITGKILDEERALYALNGAVVENYCLSLYVSKYIIAYRKRKNKR